MLADALMRSGTEGKEALRERRRRSLKSVRLKRVGVGPPALQAVRHIGGKQSASIKCPVEHCKGVATVNY